MALTLEGVHIIDARGEQPASRIVLDDGHILAVGPDVAPAGHRVALDGMLALPGFIELHTHGGGGFALHTTDPNEILAYARWVASTGTTAFVITVVGVPQALPIVQLHAAASAMAQTSQGAEPLGIHLEGPYLNPTRRGAHHPSWLRLPDPDDVRALLAAAQGQLRLVTLAPELPGAAAAITQFRDAGVTVSIGHTDATYEQARDAIAHGISHATHCFNAMPPLLHRAPGPLGAIIEAKHVTGELIVDGVHVHPAAARALLYALGAERTVAITDAQPIAGVAELRGFTFAGQPAEVRDGAARLADGTIAGSILTMDQALRNLVQTLELDLPTASRLLSLNPARVAGAAERKGIIAAGYDADIVLLDKGLCVQATFCRGRLAYVSEEWRERFPAEAAYATH